MKNNSNITKFRKKIDISIGLVVFILFTIYILFNIFFWRSKEGISVFEVQYGSISTNHVYEGIAIRNEHVVTSPQGGYAEYYLRNGRKIGVNDLVCSIHNGKKDYTKVDTINNEAIEKSFSESAYNVIDNFIQQYKDSNYQYTYEFKNTISDVLMESVNLSKLEEIGNSTEASNGNFKKIYANDDGVFSFFSDGMEDIQLDQVSENWWDKSNYKNTDLSHKESISNGDVLYRYVDSEDWNIVLPVSQDIFHIMAPKDDEDKVSVVEIKIKKDHFTTWVNYNAIEKDGQYYINLILSRHMVRYINDRFLEIELLLNDDFGLKIPVTSVVTREVYEIPKGYITFGDNSMAQGVLLKEEVEGKEKVNFKQVNVLGETEDTLYIDVTSDISEHEILLPDSSERLKLNSVTTIEGVYVVNTGISKFRIVVPLTKGKDYYIVDTNTKKSISLYDHIALIGDKVKDDDYIIH